VPASATPPGAGPPPASGPGGDTVRPKVTIKLGAISRSNVGRARVLTLSEAATVTLRALRVRKRSATTGVVLGKAA
jgi:hypothetical protein